MFRTAAACLALTGVLQASAAELRQVRDASTVSIFDGNRLVLRYRYAGVPMKPYADQLVSPAGVQILRDAPADHLHHHGLMYAMEVDGVNFWEESTPQSGQERHRSLSESDATRQAGSSQTGFVETLDWTGPASTKPMLTERRTIGVIDAPELGATLVDWRCHLQAPPDKNSIVLGGHHYFGLGIRFLTSMDKGGRFVRPDGPPGTVVSGDQLLTLAKWTGYTAKAGEKPVTVAIFDHPDNRCHPALMFTMTNPFAYLSATINAWKQPATLKAGAPLNLHYGVALWDGEVDKATIEKLYARWLELTAK
jgi:hypothetical protein